MFQLSCTHPQPPSQPVNIYLNEDHFFNTDSTLVEPKQKVVNIDQHLKKYSNLKQRISNYQSSLKSRADINQSLKFQQSKKYLSAMLTDSIFNYWLGTPWDFYGHTPDPRKGEVACGYFVSTTVRDLGFKINRFKIAQKAASEIIHDLCDKEKVKTFNSLNKLSQHLTGNYTEEDVLIVGLSFHVGFIFKKEGQFHFAHSNYIDREGVVIEPLESSEALTSSSIYVVGSLFDNRDLMESWLN